MKKYMIIAIMMMITATVSMAQGLVPLKLELPQPMFVGTPKTIKSADSSTVFSRIFLKLERTSIPL